MENDLKLQKRGRKPKTAKTEEPLLENFIVEGVETQSVLSDEIPEPEPILEEKMINEFIQDLTNEIENPKEEMKNVIEEIFEELKEIISVIEEPKEPIKTEINNVEKREEVIEEVIKEIKESVETVIEETVETVIKEAKEVIEEMKEEVINKTLEIKSLLNLLIIISVRQDMQEKYGLTPELVKILQLIIQKNSSFFFKIEDSFKKILEDNKIDSDDVPELMSLFSAVYELLFSLKLTASTVDISNICGELIKLTFNIMLAENIIIFESSGREETLKIFNALVDSSISLIKLSKTIKFSNKCCFFW
jgi:hypothetical protein